MPDENRGFAGLKVAAFESRRATEMASLIERFGGVPLVSPSMREVPIADNREAVDFAHRRDHRPDRHHHLHDRRRHRGTWWPKSSGTSTAQRFLAAMSDITTIARGPKPVAVLKELGLQPTYRVPEPNTWREVLATIDAHVHVAQQTVGLQEYGQPNASLVAGLEARGAHVDSVKVYNWDLPARPGPAGSERPRDRRRRDRRGDVHFQPPGGEPAADGRADCNSLPQLRRGMSRAVVASIGPTTSETLHEFEFRVDVEPEHSQDGAAGDGGGRAAAARRERKRPADHPCAGADATQRRRPAWDDSLFMKACRREPTERTPIWLMRQAGRYMSEYREVRAKTTFLELCKNPQLCAEVMLTAVESAGRRRGDHLFRLAADPRADGHGAGIRRTAKGRSFTTRCARPATSIG